MPPVQCINSSQNMCMSAVEAVVLVPLLGMAGSMIYARYIRPHQYTLATAVEV